MEWVLKRNCSISPRQMLVFYASLCAVSLGIATVFWVHGATMVMPFAWAELLGVGGALLVYARHAGDAERIVLQPGRLTVERCDGGGVERMEFHPDWVQVRRQDRRSALVELSCQGRSVQIGRHVRPELRQSLAEELRMALRGMGLSSAPVGRAGHAGV